MLPLQLLLIFVAGLVTDALVAHYTVSVARGRPVAAAASSAAVALLNLSVVAAIVAWMDEHGALAVLFYATGNCVGTYLAVRRAVQRGVLSDGPPGRPRRRGRRRALPGRLRSLSSRPRRHRSPALARLAPEHATARPALLPPSFLRPWRLRRSGA